MAMTAIALDPASAELRAASRSWRARLARLERPLLLAGLALVTAHLLDLALSGPATAVLGVLSILAVPLAWALAQPHVTRATRLGLGVAVGLVVVGFGVASHGLHVVNCGPDWRDVTGVGYIVGGLLLVAAGLLATAAPRRAPRRTALGWRAAHAAGWIAGAAVIGAFGVMAVRAGQPRHARPALGDPGVGARDFARGAAHRHARRSQAGGLVCPVAQRRGRPAQPRVRWQPRPRDGSRAHARAPRLRRARAR